MSTLTIKTLEGLFISKVRIKALKYFTLNLNRPIHLRAAVREFNEEINAVRRELGRLEEVKLVESETKGNKKYFVGNPTHPLFNELISIFNKSYGLGGEILSNSKKLGELEFVFLTAAFTKAQLNATHLVDMVIVGNVDMALLEEIIHKIQNELGREIHYMVLKSSDFHIRKRRRDQLIMDLMVQDNVMLIGDYEEFVK